MRKLPKVVVALLVGLAPLTATVAQDRSRPAAAYGAITPVPAAAVVLDGKSLSIDQLVAIARDGATVSYAPAAKERMADAYGLLLQGATEGMPIYWFNRGAGTARETVIFAGDPESAQNRPTIAASQLRAFRGGAASGYGPEIAEEEVVRAMMAARANGIVHNAPSPALAQMLVDLLNLRITPVVNARGTVGEGDLAQLANIGAAMVGEGDVWFRGTRMPAAVALKRAGLKPLAPFAADSNALTSSNAYAIGLSALLVAEARHMLEWADVAYAFDLNGMNSSVTPLSLAVQADRPDPWLNWHAATIREMIRGSYLFDADPKRIIQDPESLRASSIRQASAWRAWSRLHDSVLFQLNSSDHNPVVAVGLMPKDGWDLATPHMMRYFVKGGPQSRGKSGYIMSNANWDPYPLANDIEAFSIALANMDVAILNRMQRFSSSFFTVVNASDVLPVRGGGTGGYAPVDLWQEIQALAVPIAAEGNSMGNGVEELQAQTRLKTTRARALVANTLSLIEYDLSNGARWIDVRRAQDPQRKFGPAVEKAWSALRQVVPLVTPEGGPPQRPATERLHEFVATTRPGGFFTRPPLPGN